VLLQTPYHSRREGTGKGKGRGWDKEEGDV